MSREPAIVSASGLQLRTFTQGDVVVVACAGKLLSENAMHLKNHVKEMIPREKRIALELIEITRMDSAGLGTLVGLYISAKNANCELRLVNLSTPVRDLLGLSHLLSVFEAQGSCGTRLP
ncbi:MAG: STAS domain-containing protein [Candidatus Acidiferrales bacterium]